MSWDSLSARTRSGNGKCAAKSNRSNKSPDVPASDMLTNAPAYLVTKHFSPEGIIADSNRVDVFYGGGMYHWGLTIGDTNFVPDNDYSHHFEKLADGIYYWSGD